MIEKIITEPSRILYHHLAATQSDWFLSIGFLLNSDESQTKPHTKRSFCVCLFAGHAKLIDRFEFYYAKQS